MRLVQSRRLGARQIRGRKTSGVSLMIPLTAHVLHCLEECDLLHMDCVPAVLSLKGVV